MRYPLIIGLVAALAQAACNGRDEGQDPPPNPNRSRVLAGVPVFPGAVLEDTTGSPEAERRLYQVPAAFDSVAAFYRREMPANGWALMNDQSDATVANLYLRRDPATVWIRVQPRVGGGASVELLSTTLSGTPRDTASPPR